VRETDDLPPIFHLFDFSSSLNLSFVSHYQSLRGGKSLPQPVGHLERGARGKLDAKVPLSSPFFLLSLPLCTDPRLSFAGHSQQVDDSPGPPLHHEHDSRVRLSPRHFLFLPVLTAFPTAYAAPITRSTMSRITVRQGMTSATRVRLLFLSFSPLLFLLLVVFPFQSLPSLPLSLSLSY
jgi:hypothetical protein